MQKMRSYPKDETRKAISFINRITVKKPISWNPSKEFEKLLFYLKKQNLPCLYEYFYYLAGRMQLEECDFKFPKEVFLWKQYFDDEIDSYQNESIEEKWYYEVKEEDLPNAFSKFIEDRTSRIWDEITDQLKFENEPSDPDCGGDFDVFEGYGNWGRGEG